MPLRMWGQYIIQSGTPDEDPVIVGTLWFDEATALLKVCTAVAPSTFAALDGRWTMVAQTVSAVLDASTAQFVKADASSGAIVLTLPSVAGVLPGTMKSIKKMDASGHPVTVVAFAGELIDGEATQILSTQWTAMVLVSDSVGWNIT